MTEQTKKVVISSRVADEGDFGNTISFVGNLGRDPEMTYKPDGTAQTKFSVGIWAGSTKDAQGNKLSQTLWLNVTFWEDWAEATAEQLKKGMRVKIVGRLRSYMWQGTTRYEVAASWAQILTKRPIVSELSSEEKVDDVDSSITVTPF